MALASINGSEAAGSSNSHFEAVDAVKFQMSLLHLACDDQDVTSAARLLQRGENVDARDIDGWTPLLYACCMGNERLVKTLLDFGASVNAITKTEAATPLHVACDHGHANVIDRLLQRGANIEAEAKVGLILRCQGSIYSLANAITGW
eukprot:TRINITY_DN11290_c0_g1_i1.p3 TRINITY_DN11290_c0_g1~~TRINITY_DN11290_c0_g1_i1.p3  ORF type:complete len:148 (+),score=16.93 TRINITY_DN11290_c0_g1_i1:1308-1751(+)